MSKPFFKSSIDTLKNFSLLDSNWSTTLSINVWFILSASLATLNNISNVLIYLKLSLYTLFRLSLKLPIIYENYTTPTIITNIVNTLSNEFYEFNLDYPKNVPIISSNAYNYAVPGSSVIYDVLKPGWDIAGLKSPSSVKYYDLSLYYMNGWWSYKKCPLNNTQLLSAYNNENPINIQVK